MFNQSVVSPLRIFCLVISHPQYDFCNISSGLVYQSYRGQSNSQATHRIYKCLFLRTLYRHWVLNHLTLNLSHTVSWNVNIFNLPLIYHHGVLIYISVFDVLPSPWKRIYFRGLGPSPLTAHYALGHLMSSLRNASQGLTS